MDKNIFSLIVGIFALVGCAQSPAVTVPQGPVSAQDNLLAQLPVLVTGLVVSKSTSSPSVLKRSISVNLGELTVEAPVDADFTFERLDVLLPNVDITNLRVMADGSQISTTMPVPGEKNSFSFNLMIPKGSSKKLQIHGDTQNFKGEQLLFQVTNTTGKLTNGKMYIGRPFIDFALKSE